MVNGYSCVCFVYFHCAQFKREKQLVHFVVQHLFIVHVKNLPRRVAGHGFPLGGGWGQTPDPDGAAVATGRAPGGHGVMRDEPKADVATMGRG